MHLLSHGHADAAQSGARTAPPPGPAREHADRLGSAPWAPANSRVFAKVVAIQLPCVVLGAPLFLHVVVRVFAEEGLEKSEGRGDISWKMADPDLWR